MLNGTCVLDLRFWFWVTFLRGDFVVLFDLLIWIEESLWFVVCYIPGELSSQGYCFGFTGDNFSLVEQGVNLLLCDF